MIPGYSTCPTAVPLFRSMEDRKKIERCMRGTPAMTQRKSAIISKNLSNFFFLTKMAHHFIAFYTLCWRTVTLIRSSFSGKWGRCEYAKSG